MNILQLGGDMDEACMEASSRSTSTSCGMLCTHHGLDGGLAVRSTGPTSWSSGWGTAPSVLGLLTAKASPIECGVVAAPAGRGVATIVRDGSFAFRTKRCIEGSDGFELGVYAHGPQAEAAAEDYVDLLQSWDRDHRYGPEAHTECLSIDDTGGATASRPCHYQTAHPSRHLLVLAGASRKPDRRVHIRGGQPACAYQILHGAHESMTSQTPIEVAVVSSPYAAVGLVSEITVTDFDIRQTGLSEPTIRAAPSASLTLANVDQRHYGIPQASQPPPRLA